MAVCLAGQDSIVIPNEQFWVEMETVSYEHLSQKTHNQNDPPLASLFY